MVKEIIFIHELCYNDLEFLGLNRPSGEIDNQKVRATDFELPNIQKKFALGTYSKKGLKITQLGKIWLHHHLSSNNQTYINIEIEKIKESIFLKRHEFLGEFVTENNNDADLILMKELFRIMPFLSESYWNHDNDSKSIEIKKIKQYIWNIKDDIIDYKEDLSDLKAKHGDRVLVRYYNDTDKSIYKQSKIGIKEGYEEIKELEIELEELKNNGV